MNKIIVIFQCATEITENTEKTLSKGLCGLGVLCGKIIH